MNLLPLLIALVVTVGSWTKPADGRLYPLVVRLPLIGEPPEDGESVWPKPSQHTVGKLVMALDKKKFSIDYESSLNTCEREILDKLWIKYENIVFPPSPLGFISPGSSYKLMTQLRFRLTKAAAEQENYKNRADCQNDYYPVIEDTEKEAYTVEVKSGETVISASSIWGLVRGLETFSQLVYSDSNKRLLIKETTIQDKPRFYYRGVLIDTARHYMPIPMIKKHLDAMLYNKFNVFHWHVTDDQSFPFESDAYPELSKKGAFSAEHVYTKKDVADIIEFARIRGIRVIPEFDTPGHTYSWGLSHPELITVCYGNGTALQPIYGLHGAREILNPISDFTYEFVKNLLVDLRTTFKDPYIHMGMDEVYYACWLSNPDIAAFMQQNGLTSIKQVEQHYTSKVLDIAKDLNFKTIVWQDVWDNEVEVETDTILEIWKTVGQSSNFTWNYHVEKSTREGHKTILSAPWYLNYIKYGSDWYDYYAVEPLNFNGTDEQKKLLIGGEACMWSEFVDGANSISRLWPRASSVGERLWSAASVNDREEAKFRLEDQRCRMLRRGIEAAPIFLSVCGDYDPYMTNNVINNPIFNYDNKNSANRPVLSNLLLILLAFSLAFLIKPIF